MTGSSLFMHLKIIKILKKQNASSGIRTHIVSVEGFEVLHYAIKSLGTSQSYQIIYFVEMTGNVIYFTINGKLVLSSKLKIRQNKFLVGSDWKYMKLTLHEAVTAQID